MRKIIIAGCVYILSTQLCFAQYIKSLAFDITYAPHQQALTNDHKETLVEYLDYLKSDQIIIFNIDTSFRSNKLENEQRITFLKEFLIKKGVAPELILLMKRDDITQTKNDPDDFESISCKILYSTADKDKKISKDTTSNALNNDPTVSALGKYGSTSCHEDTSILMENGIKLALNKCDLDRFKDKIILKPTSDPKTIFSNAEFLKLKTNFMRAYDFYINGSQVFMFGNVIKIPIESCLNKEDLSVYLYKDNKFKLLPIENIHSPEDLFIVFKISEFGQVVLTFTNHLKPYKINFELDKSLVIENLTINTQCNDMFFYANTKKNKATITITETHYEPTLSLRAKGKNGRSYSIKNSPLSHFIGEDILKDFRVYLRDSKNREEKTFPVFKNYTIPINDLKIE